MIGDGVARAARWVLRPQTYRLIVEPAIADLQFEAPCGAIACVRGYAGVWRALATAIVHDAASDTVEVVTALAKPAPLWHGAGTFVVVAVPLMLPVAAFAPSWTALLLSFPSVVPIAILPALTLAVREAVRGRAALRGLRWIAVLAAILLFLIIDQGVTRTNQAFREVAAGAAGFQHVPRGPREMTMSELLGFSVVPDPTSGHPRSWARSRPETRRTLLREAHARAALAASALAYVLLGICLARVRLRLAALILLAICVAHSQLLLVPRLAACGTLAEFAAAVWLTPATLIAVAAIALRWQAARRTRNAAAR